MDHTILVVDDEVDIRELVVYILEDAGFTVLEARTGAEALGILASQHIDLLILDIMLPDMRGWDIARELDTNITDSPVPVVVFTVRSPGQDEDELACLQPGCFIQKPFERLELLQAVDALLHTDIMRREALSAIPITSP
jgi:DNA-binding response OmpR family regulator